MGVPHLVPWRTPIIKGQLSFFEYDATLAVLGNFFMVYVNDQGTKPAC